MPLPFGVIGVLDRKFTERRLSARRKRFVKRRQFLVKDTDGPAVSDNMVHGYYQDVFVWGEPKQDCANQWPARKIERAHCFLFEPALRFRFAFCLWQFAQVNERKLKR